MSKTDKLLKATLTRLKSRINNKMVEISNKIESIAKDAPENIQKEWEIFQKEVIDEAERIEKEENEEKTSRDDSPANIKLINIISKTRDKISEINKNMEA